MLDAIASLNTDQMPTVKATRKAIEIARKIIDRSGSVYPDPSVSFVPDKFKQLLRRKVGTRGRSKPTGVQRDFVDFVAVPDEKPGNKVKRAEGSAYAYTSSPLEKSQRISTNAQAARSLEMALSVAASLPTQGLSGGLDLGYVRESAGIAEAFESQPIVVGFAERRATIEREVKGTGDPVYQSDHQAPQIGWVFGPKVRMNPEKSELKLIHGFATHEVSGDLSIPGWWPHVDVILETAWIGNLHNSGRPIRLEDEAGQGFHRERFKVALPLNAADLDGLTEFIAQKVAGTSLPFIAIRHVEPFFISACSSKVELLVRGANVWRSARAFLGGMEADEISILPDMEGIVATFDLDKLFGSSNQSLEGLGLEQGVRLTVWTRNGSDDVSMRLLGNRTPGTGGKAGTCLARTTVAPATQPERFEIVDVSPPQICAKWTEANFVVKTVNSTENVSAIFGKSLIKGLPRSRVYTLTFDGGPFAVGGRQLPLTMTNDKDVSTVPIRVVDCEKKASIPAPKEPAPKKGGTIVGSNTVAKLVSKKYEFEVTLKGIDATLVDNDLRLGLLPDIPKPGNDWILSKTSPDLVPQTKDMYVARFAIAKDAPKDPEKAFRLPRKPKFSLLQQRGSGPKVLAPVKGTLIYYPDVSSTVVNASGPTKLSKAGDAVTFTLPVYYKEAYPTLDKASVMAEVQGQSAVSLLVDVDFSKVDSRRKVKGSIKLKDEISALEWGKLKGIQTIQLTFDGSDLPSISPLTINK